MQDMKNIIESHLGDCSTVKTFSDLLELIGGAELTLTHSQLVEFRAQRKRRSKPQWVFRSQGVYAIQLYNEVHVGIVTGKTSGFGKRWRKLAFAAHRGGFVSKSRDNTLYGVAKEIQDRQYCVKYHALMVCNDPVACKRMESLIIEAIKSFCSEKVLKAPSKPAKLEMNGFEV